MQKEERIIEKKIKLSIKQKDVFNRALIKNRSRWLIKNKRKIRSISKRMIIIYFRILKSRKRNY